MLKKVAFGVVGLALLASPFFAAADTDVQSQIAALLAQIRALQAQIEQLRGQPLPQSAPSGAQCVDLANNMGPDDTDASTGGDVTKLQTFLVSQNLLDGSLPHGYFGPATVKAVQRWQSSHNLISSGDSDSTGYGYVGPRTRAAMGCGGTMTLPTTSVNNPPTTTATPSNSNVCADGYIFHNGMCKPRMMNLTASLDPKFYLSDRIAVARVWDDWRNYAPLVTKVAELTAGKTDDLEKAKAILDWVHASKTYGCPQLVNDLSAPCNNSPANNNANFAAIFDDSIGVCLDASIISTAMLRAAGIAATPRFIYIDHIVTIFYANGVWYSADATFSNDRATAGHVQVASLNEMRAPFDPSLVLQPGAHNIFIPFVAGEIESSMKLNGLYCDNEFCMGIPFRTNRILSNSGIKTARVTFPAMTIANYDFSAGKQIFCDLKTRGMTSGPPGTFGRFVRTSANNANNPWQLAEVQYSIGSDDPVGYITADVPIGDSTDASGKIEYRFECSRGLIWGADSEKPIAYEEVAPNPGERVVITYKNLVKDASASDEEFAKTVAFVKASTEDLGIYPDAPVTKSLANPLLRTKPIIPASADLKANGSDGPLTVKVGDSVTYTWTSQDASSCTISYTGPTSGSSVRATSDTYVAGPYSAAQIGTYVITLTCGAASDTLTVIVAPAAITPPATADLKANGSDGPLTVAVGASVNYSWTSSGVSSCTLSYTGPRSGSSTWPLSGTQTSTYPISDIGTFTIVMECTPQSGGATVKDSFILNVIASSGARTDAYANLASALTALESALKALTQLLGS